MPRLRGVPRSEVPEDIRKIYDMLFEGRDPVAEPGTATGTPGNWWTVFARVPDCFRHAVAGFAFYRMRTRGEPEGCSDTGTTSASSSTVSAGFSGSPWPPRMSWPRHLARRHPGGGLPFFVCLVPLMQ